MSSDPKKADAPAGPRPYSIPQGRTRFMVGKYEVVGKPMPGSMHMLRYTVSVAGTKIGTTVSVPTESDCRYLEKPPVVPPLKPFQVTYRPGRPKKSAAPPPQAAPETRQAISAEELPPGVSLNDLGLREDR